jgi:hypothetical protein
VKGDHDPWADREGPFSLARYVNEQPATDFFIPYRNDPAEAEDLWLRLVAGNAACRRVYSLTYRHEDQRIEVRVGEERKVFRRKTGWRGGYMAGTDFDRRYRREGAVVLAIVDAGDLIRVWSVAQDGRWPNPSIVSPGALERIQYFRARRQPPSAGDTYQDAVPGGYDLRAGSETPFSFSRHVTEQPTADFFIPYLTDAAEAEQQWLRLAGEIAGSKRVCSLTHTQYDQRIEVTVGEERKVFSRKTGRRGAYIAAADFDRRYQREGTTVLVIVDAGDVIRVWSAGPADRWPNPSLVFPATVERIRYFRQGGP